MNVVVPLVRVEVTVLERVVGLLHVANYFQGVIIIEPGEVLLVLPGQGVMGTKLDGTFSVLVLVPGEVRVVENRTHLRPVTRSVLGKVLSNGDGVPEFDGSVTLAGGHKPFLD